MRHGGAHSLRRKSPRGPGLRHWAHVEPPRSDAGGLLAGPACPPSHLKMPVRERLGVVARHATHMASRRDGGRAAGMALDIGPNSRRRYTAAAAQATARPAARRCGCHPVSAARGQSIDRTRAAARHDHGSLRAHGTRPLAACVGIAACLQHLVGEPRTCCGHLPSGTGSRFVRETRDEQWSGELAAAHPHMRLGSWPVRMQSGSNVRDSGRLKESLQVGRQRSGHRVRRRPGQGAS